MEYIPDDALATLFQALYKEVSYNALVLEQKLHSGELRSVTDVCDTFGITRMVLSKTLDMLDHTPEEFSAILRETY